MLSTSNLLPCVLYVRFSAVADGEEVWVTRALGIHNKAVAWVMLNRLG
jgi:hypothetical protein